MRELHRRPLVTTAVLALALALVLGACSSDAIAESAEENDNSATGDGISTDTGTETAGDRWFDPSAVHEMSIEFDEIEYRTMLETYAATGEKEWMSATVTLDGATYEDVGIRLKGNSSLRGLSGGAGGPGMQTVSSDEPASLPWLIRLDKFVDGQNHDGLHDLVVRSNMSATSMNEAVALDLLAEAGLASQKAVATRLTVNGSDPVLRLVIEHPDDVWMAENFDADDALYKAESTGDYSYRGDDPDDYDEVFDQEAGKDNTDLTPLIEFLEFVNDTDDATFETELDQWLDVDAFATYLAMQDIVDNFDDIDGPGNNSYLHYDTETGRFTVVPWDHNLALGVGPGFGPGFGFGGDQSSGSGRVPEGFQPPVDGQGAPIMPSGPDGFPPMMGDNPLVERFLETPEFSELYRNRLAELTDSLVDSGFAQSVIDEWTALLTEQASDLVDTTTIASEAASISASITGSR